MPVNLADYSGDIPAQTWAAYQAIDAAYTAKQASVAAKMVSARDISDWCDITGTDDAVTGLYEAQAWSSETGLPVTLETGTLMVEDSITAVPGATVVLGDDVRVEGNFGGGPLWRSPSGNSDDFYLSGGSHGRPEISEAYNGNIFQLDGEGWILSDLLADTYRGIAALVKGTNACIDGLTSTNVIDDDEEQSGGGGVRFAGAGLLCRNCDMESSDDCYQANVGSIAGADTTDVIFLNCHGVAHQGALMACLLTADLPKVVDRVVFAGVTGSSGWNAAAERGGYGFKAFNIPDDAETMRCWVIGGEMDRADSNVSGKAAYWLAPVGGAVEVTLLDHACINIETDVVELGGQPRTSPRYGKDFVRAKLICDAFAATKGAGKSNIVLDSRASATTDSLVVAAGLWNGTYEAQRSSAASTRTRARARGFNMLWPPQGYLRPMG
jgi:hypothetical protein